MNPDTQGCICAVWETHPYMTTVPHHVYIVDGAPISCLLHPTHFGAASAMHVTVTANKLSHTTLIIHKDQPTQSKGQLPIANFEVIDACC